MFILGVVSSVKITLSIFAPIYLVKIKRNVKRLLILLRYNGIICKEKKKHEKDIVLNVMIFFFYHETSAIITAGTKFKETSKLGTKRSR